MRLEQFIRSASKIIELLLKKRRRKRIMRVFLIKFLKKHERKPRLADEETYMAEFMNFLSGIRKCFYN